MFWLVKSLTSDYRRELSIPVAYTNLPPDVNLATGLPDTFKISLSGSGWKFLSGNLFSGIGYLTVDLSFLSKQNPGLKAYPSSLFVNRIPELSSSKVKMLRIEPDSLRFLMAESFSVKVPVKPDVSVLCKNQYIISGQVQWIPDSIEIFGDLQTISGISFIAANPVKLEMLAASVDTFIPLIVPEGVRTGLKSQQVRLQIPVSEFAEKQLAVPVRAAPGMNGNFKFYPDKAVLTVRVPVDKLRSINPADFSVTAEMHSPASKYSRLFCDKIPAGTELFQLSPPFAETYIEN